MLAQGHSEHAAMVFANAAAALKCASGDGLDGVPDESAVLAFMHLRGINTRSLHLRHPHQQPACQLL